MLLIFLVASSILKAQNGFDAVSNEHRFTTLETKVDAIALSVSDLKQYNWIALLGMAGLLGEAGIRIVKKPKGD